MAERCVLGVDGGTESLRAGVFDLEGRPRAFASSAYATNYPQPGWAEQNPDDWWRALGRAVRRAVHEAKVRPEEVAALSVDTTCCSVVALDAAGTPLRPALLWMDVRSGDEAAEVAASGDPALEVNGGGAGPVSAEWMVPKALWLRRHVRRRRCATRHLRGRLGRGQAVAKQKSRKSPCFWGSAACVSSTSGVESPHYSAQSLCPQSP
jgi:sugar (pentulose or hexulose) kinase